MKEESAAKNETTSSGFMNSIQRTGPETMYLKTIQNAFLKSECSKPKNDVEAVQKKASNESCYGPCEPIVIMPMIEKEGYSKKSKTHSLIANANYDKFSNNDLPQTKVSGVKFKTNRTASNPLSPIYPEIKSPELSIQEIKFLKDPLSIHDIEGTRSRWVYSQHKKEKRNELRGTLDPNVRYIDSNVQTIMFSSPYMTASKALSPQKKKRFEISKPKDIKVEETEFPVSKRCTDPNNPQYFYYNINKKPAYLDPITKATSATLHPKRDKPCFSLKTDDVPGATVYPSKVFQPDKRLLPEQMKAFVEFDSDYKQRISKKQIKTNRQLNPLDPNYKLPTQPCVPQFKHLGDNEVKLKPKIKVKYTFINDRTYSIINNCNLSDGKPSIEPIKKNKLNEITYLENDILLFKHKPLKEEPINSKKMFMNHTTDLFTLQNTGNAHIYPVDTSHQRNEFLLNFYKSKENKKTDDRTTSMLYPQTKIAHIDDYFVKKSNPQSLQQVQMVQNQTTHNKFSNFIDRNAF